MLTQNHITQIANDSFCYPQLINDPFRLKNETFAQSLKSYIDFVLDPQNQLDPNSPTSIY